MFTGIVEALGTVASIAGDENGRVLTVLTPLAEDLKPGDSVSVNGVCLTATDIGPDRFRVDVVTETLRRTNIGHLLSGDQVNLERPLRADGRFDGHMVQGHIDTHGAVVSVTTEGEGRRLEVEVGPRYRRYLADKGSIAVDGVSLTIAAVTDSGFQVALIPFTLEATNLGGKSPGSTVNLEFDVLAKYVERLLAERLPA